MIADVQAIKSIVGQHGLRFLVVYDMDGNKQHQAEGSPDKCCAALDMVARLFAREPFKVEAWKLGTGDVETGESPRNKGGKRPKLAHHYKWVVQPARSDVPMVLPPADSSPAVLQAIQGLQDRLDEIEEAVEEEPAALPEPPWLKPALDRAFAVVDLVLAKFGAVQAPAAINGGAGVVQAPADDEVMRAILRAKADPQNANYIANIVKMYGDDAAAKNPAK